MSIQNATKAVILDSAQDWKPWLHTVKAIASAGKVDVWKYINPAKETPEPIPEDPREPLITDYKAEATTDADLTAAQFERYKFAWSRYDRIISQNDRIHEGISKVKAHINTTISTHCISYIQNEFTTHGTLRNLQKFLSPGSESEKLRLRDTYRELQTFTRRENIEHWIRRWEKTYNEAKEAGLPEVQDNNACYDFLRAIASYDRVYSVSATERFRDRISDNKTVSLPELIDRFRQEVILSRYRDRDSPALSSFATFRGHESPNHSVPECLCGRRHWYGQCYYLNKDKRPKDWRISEAVQRRIQQALENNSRLKEEVEKSIQIQRKEDNKEKKVHFEHSGIVC